MKHSVCRGGEGEAGAGPLYPMDQRLNHEDVHSYILQINLHHQLVCVCVCVCLLYSILHSVALFICIPNSVATTSDDTLPCHPETITSLLKTGYTHTIELLTWLHGLMWYQRIFL